MAAPSRLRRLWNRRAYGRAKKLELGARGCSTSCARFTARRPDVVPVPVWAVPRAQREDRRETDDVSDLRPWSKNSDPLRPDPHRFFSNSNAKASELTDDRAGSSSTAL